jgi:hypothetical protein
MQSYSPFGTTASRCLDIPSNPRRYDVMPVSLLSTIRHRNTGRVIYPLFGEHKFGKYRRLVCDIGPCLEPANGTGRHRYARLIDLSFLYIHRGNPGFEFDWIVSRMNQVFAS